MNHKATALMAAVLLVSIALLGTGWITIEAEAADIDDPFDVEAAPHFADVAYSLSEPTYSTAFDSIGSWKVSAGSPAVTVTNSTMGVTAPSTTRAELTLAEEDEPGINTTVRGYMQTKVRVSNLTAQYTNITLENASSGDGAWISFHSTVTYGYSSASGSTAGTLYASPAVDTWYRVAVELTASAVTFYIYAFDGTCLANHYTNSANLTVAQVSELHLSIDGHAGTAVFDYLYVAGSPPTAEISTPSTTRATLTTNAGQDYDVCNVDPTAMDIDGSGSDLSRSVMGISANRTELLEQDELNGTELLELFGTTPELPQKFKGRYVAKGWSDFRRSLESSLKARIAYAHGTTTSNVYLVDYYIDYIQFSTEYDSRVVAQLEDNFWSALREGLEHAGIGVTSSTVEDDGLFGDLLKISDGIPRNTLASGLPFDLPGLARRSGLIIPVILAAQAGEQAGYKLQEAMARAWDILNFGNDERIDKLLDRLEGMYSDSEERVDQLWNYTMDGYDQIIGDYAAMSSWLTGTVSNITRGYDDTIDSISNLNAQYMEWAGQQFESTNAMYYQLLNRSDEAQRYFAGQLAKQNEIITNITQDVYGVISAQNGMWNDFLRFGKPEENTPLTEAQFFGSEFFTYVIVIVVCIVIIALMILLLRRPRKAKGGRRRY